MLGALFLRSPLLTVDRAAFFLQVPVSEARRMYGTPALPRALSQDGGVFEPTPGKQLVAYEGLYEQLDDTGRAMLDYWQSGRYEIPAATSDAAPAAEFKDILLSLFSGDDANVQAVEV